jgi:hypothetical protein
MLRISVRFIMSSLLFKIVDRKIKRLNEGSAFDLTGCFCTIHADSHRPVRRAFSLEKTARLRRLGRFPASIVVAHPDSPRISAKRWWRSVSVALEP